MMRAFPTNKTLLMQDDNEKLYVQSFENLGMDLRDYFAAKATEQDIQEYMWEVVTQTSHVLSKIQVRNREQARYAYADAMMKAREDHGE
jgi:hypothetical protein